MEFLNHVLPTDGYPILCVLDNGYMSNTMCQSIEELSEKILSYSGDGDLYFATATYKEFTTSSKGCRTIKNFGFAKTLWTEFDIREDKDDCYDTFEQCIAGVGELRSKLGFPEPTVVSSGGGIHVYWTLTDAISLEEWRLASNALIQCARHMHVLIDVAGTNKPTQIFRPPNSINTKYDEPVVVSWTGVDTSYETLMGGLNGYVVNNSLVANNHKVKKYDETEVFDLRDWNEVSKCAQLQQAATGSEEQWRGLISTARLCTDGNASGRELAHELSSVDPRYTPEGTDSKLDILEEQQGQRGMPYTCAKWEQLDPEPCRNCPHKGRLPNPILLGVEENGIVYLEEETLEDIIVEGGTVIYNTDVIPDVILDEASEMVESNHPMGIVTPNAKVSLGKIVELSPSGDMFSLVKEGFLVKTKVVDKKTGDIEERNEIICDQRLYPISIIVSRDEYHNIIYSYMWRVELEHGRSNDVIIPADVFTSSSSLIGTFANVGVNVVKASNVPLFGLGVRTFIKAAREKMKPIQVKNTLGWHSDEFIFGDRTITKDMVIRDAVINREMRSLVNDTLTKDGTYEGWKDAVSVYDANNQMHGQFVLATAFGAPLMKYSTVNGLLISLVGKSGCGKSTMQKVAASVWGNKNQLQNAMGTKTGDTILSVTRWIGGLRNLPVHLEEVSNIRDRDASDLAYMITQGAEKNRMQKGLDEGFKRSLGLSWQTIVTSSSNPSLVDKISTVKTDSIAEGMRIFEVSDIPNVRTQWIEDGIKIEGVDDHYGHAGEVFAQWLMGNEDKLEEWVEDKATALNMELGASSPERFWIQGMACMLVGAEIARTAGIFPFKMDELERFVIRQFGRQRNRTKTTTKIAETSASFIDMMNELIGETLIVNVQGDIVELLSRPQRGVLSARLDTSVHRIHISVNRMRKYANENNIPLPQLLQDAINAGYATFATLRPIQYALGAGVEEFDIGKSSVYKFDMSQDSEVVGMNMLEDVIV